MRRVLSSEQLHLFVSVPPKPVISDLVHKMKGRSPFKVQQKFPRYVSAIGAAGSGGGVFFPTNGAIPEDIVLQYLQNHIQDSNGASW